MPLLAYLIMEEPSMKTPGTWGFVCFLFFRKTNNYPRKGTTIQARPSMSPWVHPGALTGYHPEFFPGHQYPPIATIAPHCVRCTLALAGSARGAGEHPR